MKVPFFRPDISDAAIDDVAECLRSGWLTTGPRVRAFEREFADYVGAEHAVAVNSCTAALHLALAAVGVSRGDLVIVPSLTFAATAEVVCYFDAVPVFADCDRDTLCIDPGHVDRLVADLAAGWVPPGAQQGAPLRAIIPVHYGGHMADMPAIRAIAGRADVAVIEDAAHAVPSRLRDSDGSWTMAGRAADLSCFSFYANKCITTGEGGMLTTADQRWAERARLLSLHGLSRDAWGRFSDGGNWYYEVTAPGYKYNMTDMAAALGRRQLARADELRACRAAVAARYTAGLSGLPSVVCPSEREGYESSWHLYAIRLAAGGWRADRSRVIAELASRGVTCSVHWMPLHLSPCYQQRLGTGPDTLPNTEAAWSSLISLPIFPSMTDAEVDYVVESLHAIATDQAA